VGLPPLPPYILAARKKQGESETRQSDFDRYQTVYAREFGSVAAPTAGLHFTPELLAKLDAAHVRRADVVLHVGSGTFKPVKAEHVEEHEMHSEWCSLPHGVRRQIVATHRSAATPRPRVICVGTTTARTVESYAGLEAGVGGDMTDHLWPASMDTRLLITPGYAWRWTDGLLTNFHLPRSTLLAMVGSLLEDPARAGSGVERLRRLYGVALERGYRFFSFGDAMLILP
jgi:S-adenosylmethionine:tRNA ribosyltransferase-isomerase